MRNSYVQNAEIKADGKYRVSQKTATIGQNESCLYSQNVFNVTTFMTDTQMQTRYQSALIRRKVSGRMVLHASMIRSHKCEIL
jgi:hypothetical protein